MSIKKKENRPKEENFYGFSENCEDAMFYNGVASVNGCTGYTMKAPLTEEEATDKSRLVNAPATKYETKRNERSGKKFKTKD